MFPHSRIWKSIHRCSCPEGNLAPPLKNKLIFGRDSPPGSCVHCAHCVHAGSNYYRLSSTAGSNDLPGLHQTEDTHSSLLPLTFLFSLKDRLVGNIGSRLCRSLDGAGKDGKICRAKCESLTESPSSYCLHCIRRCVTPVL